MLNLHDYVVIGHPRWGVLDRGKAWEVCLSEGESWLSDNLTMIRKELDGSIFTVTQWSEWLANPDVQGNLAVMHDLYRENRLVHDTIKSDVETYVRRRRGNFELSSADLDELAGHLLEELAVYKYQSETRGSVNLYPGSNPVSLRPGASVSQDLPAALRTRQFVQFEIRASRRHQQL
jgi:hypothetical protein